MKKPENVAKPKCVLWMGSSIGNLNRSEAAEFLRTFSVTLGDQDLMLIGIDACLDKDKVYHAYNDREGKTLEFYFNGLQHANKLLGKEVFRQEDWKVVGEYDEDAGCHHAFYAPIKDTKVEGTTIKAGERVRFEESYKYSRQQSNVLWSTAGLMRRAIFGDGSDEYRE